MILVGEITDQRVGNEIIKNLKQEGITSKIDISEETGTAFLFVEDEKDLETATDMLRVYLGVKKPYVPSQDWIKIKSLPNGVVTLSVIFFCVAIYLIQEYGNQKELLSTFFFATEKGMPKEILNGEVWRLWTPLFLHFGLLHIVFNMMWWKDLANILENTRSSKTLIFFVLIVGAISNIGQYYIGGPSFGGMSGVVYGLLGYVWMGEKLNPTAEFKLPKQDVVLMIAWFFLCLTGTLVFKAANMAHALGLSAGMFYGIVDAYRFSEEKPSMNKISQYMATALGIIVITLGVEIFRI
jgi:GlpG protein